MEGEGPAGGTPRQVGAIIASADCVALDVVASAMAGLDPMEVYSNKAAARRGLGPASVDEVEVSGVDWRELAPDGFALPARDLSAKMPPWLGKRLRGWTTARPRPRATRRVHQVQAVRGELPGGRDRGRCERARVRPRDLHPLLLLPGALPAASHRAEGARRSLGSWHAVAGSSARCLLRKRSLNRPTRPFSQNWSQPLSPSERQRRIVAAAQVRVAQDAVRLVELLHAPRRHRPLRRCRLVRVVLEAQAPCTRARSPPGRRRASLGVFGSGPCSAS